MSTDCGCNNTSGEPSPDTPDYLLVRATGKNASKCGDVDTVEAAAADCPKSDLTFDYVQADFSFPDTSAVPMLVCNGSLYAVGQWIHLVAAGATMQIVAINANELTVRGVCSNGATLDRNPIPGTIIRKNDLVIVVESPECLTDAEKAERAASQFAEAKQLCLPSLEEDASTTAEFQMVGWKKSDPSDSGFRKCIKRLTGFFFKGSHPYLTDLDIVDIGSAASYRPLLAHKDTGKVVKQNSLDEDLSLEAGKKYVYGVVGGNQALIEGYVFSPIDNQLIFNHGGSFDYDGWEHIPVATPLETTLNFNIESINNLEILGDYFYVQLRINLGVHNTNAFGISAALRVDDDLVSYVHGYYNTRGTNTVTVVKKVPKSSKSLPLKITMDGSGGNLKTHCSVYLDGVFV